VGNGGDSQFTTRCLCRSFLLRGRTPHTLPLLQCEGYSHRRQFSTNFSNVSTSHWLQSFRNRLLQCGFPMVSQALPAKLLQHGFLSPMFYWFWQEPAPVWGSPQGHSFLQVPTCSSVGSLPQATGGSLLHRGHPWTAGGQPATSWVFITSCKEGPSAPTSQTPPSPSFFTDLGVCRVVSLTSSHSSLNCHLPTVFFFPL